MLTFCCEVKLSLYFSIKEINQRLRSFLTFLVEKKNTI